MKRLIIAGLAMFAGLTLAACGNNPLTGKPVTAADVVAAAKAACSIAPTAEQITAAVDAANKTAASAESIGRILCAAIAPVTVPAPSSSPELPIVKPDASETEPP